MNIQAKTVTNTTSVSYQFNTLNDTHITNDNPIQKRLMVMITESIPPIHLQITGDDYDALGQWTDASLNAYIISKYGLTAA